MTLIPDASSEYQKTLPVSSDDLIKLLDEWGIIYSRTDHVPLKTVEDSKKIQHQFLSSDEGGGHIKNLYLRDNKKRNILIVAEQDRGINLKLLSSRLGVGRLSFGSAERLMDNLGVRPGAVTPLAMITGAQQGVTLFIDHELKNCAKIYVHPLVNDRTLGISPDSLNNFLNKVGVQPEWIDLSETADPNR